MAVFKGATAGADMRQTVRRLNVLVDDALDNLAEAILATWRTYIQRYPEDEAGSENLWFQLRSDLHHRLDTSGRLWSAAFIARRDS